MGVIDVSTHKNERRGNPPFQFRLDPELRELMEQAQQQDGDESLAAWIKRILRKELQSRGLEPKNGLIRWGGFFLPSFVNIVITLLPPIPLTEP